MNTVLILLCIIAGKEKIRFFSRETGASTLLEEEGSVQRNMKKAAQGSIPEASWPMACVSVEFLSPGPGLQVQTPDPR